MARKFPSPPITFLMVRPLINQPVKEKPAIWNFRLFSRETEISVDRLNTTPKLVIMWNVTLWVWLNRGFFIFLAWVSGVSGGKGKDGSENWKAWYSGYYFLSSCAKVTSITQSMYHSKLWLSKSFNATLGLTLKGHEAGLLHAHWVTISCGLFFCRCSW